MKDNGNNGVFMEIRGFNGVFDIKIGAGGCARVE
jgi:hypothetical protein